VDAKDVEEEGGVASKPVEPERPAGSAATPAGQPAHAPGKVRSYNPSAVEPDPKAARAQELEVPRIMPSRAAGQVEPEKAAALLRDMKAQESSPEERQTKMEELVAQVRNASSSDEKMKEAQELFEEAEKLHSQKKYKAAAAGYRKVLTLVPQHEQAHERLKQCYGEMEEEGKLAVVLKKPATAQDVLLLEQKFAAAVSLYDEGSNDDALKKFKEVVEMIEWSTMKIDTKNYLGKAHEYMERIKIEKELEKEPAKEKEEKQPEKKEPAKDEKKAPEQPQKPGKIPGPGDIAPG
jgi:tetratricopeptide (TPR) repeat protein